MEALYVSFSASEWDLLFPKARNLSVKKTISQKYLGMNFGCSGTKALSPLVDKTISQNTKKISTQKTLSQTKLRNE